MSITVVNKPVTPLANTANYTVPEANADLVVKDKKILKNKQLLQDMMERMMIVRKFEERVLMIVKTKINFDDIINIIGVKEDY